MTAVHLPSIGSSAWLHADDLSRWRACARRFWLVRHQDREVVVDVPAADPAAEAAVVHGPAPEDALRAAFPLAERIAAPRSEAEWAAALQHTHACLAAGGAAAEGWALFGACFASDHGVRVRVDVVTRGANGLRLFKLRLATVANEADVDTMALAAYVAARAGYPVASAGLLLVETSFVYPGHGCYAGLLREVDLAPALPTRPIAAWVAAMHACAQAAKPAVPLGAPCTQGGGCEVLDACGLPADPGRLSDARVSLDVVGRDLAAELRTEGHADLTSVALARLVQPRHRRAARAVQLGAPVLEPDAAVWMRAQPWPRRWLRFETIGFAVPIWSGTRPYQVVPFQWTCDIATAPGTLVHDTFLAGANGDPRRAFAESLLQALGEDGPVFAYNAGFEINRIRELAQHADDLAAPLMALLPRIVDLFQVLRAHYYHPDMAGSWSAKSVFRAVAPDLRADRFDAAGFDSPLQAFAASLRRDLDEASAQALRAALLAHGQRQTAALRRITALLKAADGNQPSVRQTSR